MVEEVRGAVRREAAFERDWTKGSIFRNLLSLAWPMIVTESFFVVGPTADMIFVGRLGAASIAGVGVAGIVVMVLMSARWGLNTGTRAMVARFVGAGDPKAANHVAQQAFVVSGIYAVVVGAIGFFFAEPILSLLGLEADVVAEGAAYMRVQFAAAAVMSFWMISEAIMQASGDAVAPMKIAVGTRVVHVVLDPFFIFGWWIFPRLGVSGAAMANVVGYSLGMALGLWVLLTGRSRLWLSFRSFRLDLNIIWRIVKIGIPASVMGVQRSLGNLVLVRFIVPFGTLAVAAHSLCQRIEMILHVQASGLGMAAGVLVGQNLGARQPGRADRSGWQALGLGEGYEFICSLMILLWAEGIIHIFSSDPGLVKIGSTFLRIAAAGYLAMGFEAVLQQCISVAGDTVPPMVVSLATVWLLQLPSAFPSAVDYQSRCVRSALGDGERRSYRGCRLRNIFPTGQVEAEKGLIRKSQVVASWRSVRADRVSGKQG